MEKYMTNERTGIRYELVGEYYLPLLECPPGPKNLGVWGQRHRSYLREHNDGIYTGLLLSGKLNAYLEEVDRQAEKMYALLIKRFAAQEGITEKLKMADRMAWVQKMNGIHARAREIVNQELIYT